MIGFAVCVGDRDAYAARAARGLRRVREDDTVIAELTADGSIHAAYNAALDRFATVAGLEALVLLHEDVELLDSAFCARVREALRDPDVAVVGAIGARGVRSLAWWEGEIVGRVAETRGLLDHGFAQVDVDAVDGMLLVLSPWAVRNLRFDADAYTGFHGYDVDLCFSARAAGRRVVVADLAVAHYTKGGFGHRAAWDAADAAFRRKWRGEHAAPGPAASLLVVLDGGADRALRCLEAIAALADDEPDHEIVVVANGAPDLEPLLARLDGDVTIVRCQRVLPFAAAVERGLARCRARVVALLRDAPLVDPRFLTPLVATLRDGRCAAAVPALERGAVASPVGAHGLAAHRADLAAALPVAATAPAGLELPALCLALAQRGAVRTVPDSAVRPQPRPQGGPRRAPGEPVELSIVIPTLDAAGERTRRCIAAAQAATDVAHEIIVVDNGAPPQGFTAPVNAGLRAARGRYLLVLNDDVELLPGWWPPLRAALDEGEAVVFPLTVDGGMRHDFAAWCFAFTRATLEEMAVAEGEFLDPDLVVWYQDTDLLERLRRAGRPPRCVEASRIRHGLSQTVASDDPQLRAWIRRQVQADRERFEAKHGTNVAGAAR